MQPAPDMLGILQWAVTALGPVATAILLFQWINRRGASKRTLAEEPQPSFGGTRALMSMIERSDGHLKEHTAVLRDASFSIQKLSAMMDAHTADINTALREAREHNRITNETINRMAENVMEIKMRSRVEHE